VALGRSTDVSQGNIQQHALLRRMPPLVRFLMVNFATGFLAGLTVGMGYIFTRNMDGLLTEQPLGAAMSLWAFAASFALGAICTGLALLPRE
jgi:hypothetical protein